MTVLYITVLTKIRDQSTLYISISNISFWYKQWCTIMAWHLEETIRDIRQNSLNRASAATGLHINLDLKL
jgi:hypothetical protein